MMPVTASDCIVGPTQPLKATNSQADWLVEDRHAGRHDKKHRPTHPCNWATLPLSTTCIAGGHTPQIPEKLAMYNIDSRGREMDSWHMGDIFVRHTTQLQLHPALAN